MKVAIGLGAPYASDINDIQLENQITYVVEAEKLGVDSAWSAEAWGYDAITPLAYLAAKTSRIRLGTGIMQIGSRTPAMIAMTALTMASLAWSFSAGPGSQWAAGDGRLAWCAFRASLAAYTRGNRNCAYDRAR